jgi:hypothetical protein
MTAGRVLKGIEFAHPEGSAPLLLDLYLPAAPERSGALPALIHYHGGGWRVGARSSLGTAVDALRTTVSGRVARATAQPSRRAANTRKVNSRGAGANSTSAPEMKTPRASPTVAAAVVTVETSQRGRCGAVSTA